MYEVILKDINTGVTRTIHDIYNSKILKGDISQSINAIDSFSFDILSNNIGFNFITAFKTHVEVLNTKTNKYAFKGRVLISTSNMDQSGLIYKNVTCESRLAYLCDTRVPLVPETYYTGYVGDEYEESMTGLEEFIDVLLDNHNSRVEDYKQIHRGIVTVQPFESSSNVTKALDGQQTTWEALQDKLVKSFGGEFQLREVEGLLYLDYVTQLGETKSTSIELSKNLKTVKKEIDPTTFVTRLYAYGSEFENEDGTKERLTIESANNGVPYIEDEEAKAVYGIIEAVQTFNDITVASNLLTKARSWLASNNRVLQKHTITYLDLSLIGLDIQEIEIYNTYPVKNELMGIDENLRVISRKIDVVNPQNSSIDVGDMFKTLSDIEAEKVKEVNDAVKEINTIKSDYVTNEAVESIVDTAITNNTSILQSAEEIIMSALNDYVTTGDFGAFQETVSTQFTQTAEDFTFNFNNLVNQITTVEGETQQQFQEINKYIRFEDGNIILGETGNEITLKIENDRIAFIQNNIEVAYITNNELYITDTKVANSFKIGDFAYIPRENRSLDFKKVTV